MFAENRLLVCIAQEVLKIQPAKELGSRLHELFVYHLACKFSCALVICMKCLPGAFRKGNGSKLTLP